MLVTTTRTETVTVDLDKILSLDKLTEALYRKDWGLVVEAYETTLKRIVQLEEDMIATSQNAIEHAQECDRIRAINGYCRCHWLQSQGRREEE